jgi:hypothetical protein
MKFAKTIIAVLSALALSVSTFAAGTTVGATNAPVAVETVAAPTTANAWVVSLGGVGESVTAGDTETVFGVDLSVGYTGQLLLPLEAGVRQGVSYDGDGTVLNTRLYGDWTLVSLAKNTFDVFAGANVGVTYGDLQSVWTAAPEAGLRWWVKDDVSILFRAEFPFRLNDGAEFTDSIRYFVGFQVKFL